MRDSLRTILSVCYRETKNITKSHSGLRHYSGDQIEKNVTGGTYSTYRGEKRFMQDFGGEI